MAPLVYLIKFSVCLAVCWLFYQTVLRRLTFYSWNRWYLLLYPLLCGALPFVDVRPAIATDQDLPGVLHYIPAVEQYSGVLAPVSPVAEPGGWSIGQWLVGIALAGFVVLMLRLLVFYLSLLRLQRRSQRIATHPVAIYQVNAEISPFSFANRIYLNRERHSESELAEILRHEFIHVRQRHTIDILFAELLCAFNWFNPFAWMIRRSIRLNLEFLADEGVLRSGIDRRRYQYLLLSVMGAHRYHVATPFSFSSLKKRIIMMNRLPSARIHVLRFLFLLPLAAVLLLAFRSSQTEGAKASGSDGVTPSSEPVRIAGRVLDRSSLRPMSGVRIFVSVGGKEVTSLRTDREGFYYYTNEIRKREGVISFGIRMEQAGYKGGSGGLVYSDGAATGLYKISLMVPAGDRRSHTNLTVDLPPVAGTGDAREEIVKMLAERQAEMIEAFLEKEKVVDAFSVAHPHPSLELTLFEGRYFSRDGHLLGQPSQIDWYLDGKPSMPEAINETFVRRGKPASMRLSTSNGMPAGRQAIGFYTGELMPAPAPASLIVGNVEELDPSEASKMRRKDDVIYFNGVRHYVLPMMKEPSVWPVRRLYRFSGALARYYGGEEVWWVESQQPSAIRNRPPISSSEEAATSARGSKAGDQPSDYQAFLKRNPSIKRVNWTVEPVRIVFEFRDGGREAVLLRDTEAVRQAEIKYGRLPQAPPPPPPSLETGLFKTFGPPKRKEPGC